MSGDHNLYLLGFGSNLGARERAIEAALDATQHEVGRIEARSRLYETAPVGAADLPFLNGAALVRSSLPPEKAMTALLAIEARLGRVRRLKWENRVIDLDILLWAVDGPDLPVVQTLATPTVTVPHPYLLDRAFALVPAADIAPRWRHPQTGRSLVDEVVARGYALA